MSSNNSPMFSHKMISLESLKNWTLFNVLKQVKAAGYSGAPSEPIAAYRTALLSTMSYNQPNENERIGPIYLKAEKAYIALDNELVFLEHVRDQKSARAAERDKIVSATVSAASSDSEQSEIEIMDPISDENSPIMAYSSDSEQGAESSNNETTPTTISVTEDGSEQDESGRENSSPIAFTDSSDSEQAEIELSDSNNETTPTTASFASNESEQTEIEVTDFAVSTASKSSKQNNSKSKANMSIKRISTPAFITPKNTKQNDKSSATKSTENNSTLVLTTSKTTKQNDKPKATRSSERTSTPISTISKSATQNDKSNSTRFIERISIPASATSEASRQNDKSTASERTSTPLSSILRSARGNDRSKASKSNKKTSTPVSAISKVSKQSSTGSRVSKLRRVTPFTASPPSRVLTAYGSDTESPRTPEKRIMKHPVPWTSPGHAYIAPEYKPSGRSDLIMGFISSEPTEMNVSGAKRKRQIIGEPIIRPVKLAKSVEAPTPYHLNLSDGPERAVRNGRRIKVVEPEPEPLPMAKLKKPVRYKYEFAPKPEYKYHDDIPYRKRSI